MYYTLEECSSSMDSLFEKKRTVGEKWKQMTQEEKEALKNKAIEASRLDIASMTVDEKAKLVSQETSCS